MSNFEVGKVILIRERSFDPADCEIVRVTEKAVRLKSVHLKHECWLPKGWLKPFKPDDSSYDGEYVIPKWIELSYEQERVLNIAE
jgi:hypothetical protein